MTRTCESNFNRRRLEEEKKVKKNVEEIAAGLLLNLSFWTMLGAGRCGLSDGLGGGFDWIDGIGRRLIVLYRAAGRSRIGEQPDRLGDAARLRRKETLAVYVQRDGDEGGQVGDMTNQLILDRYFDGSTYHRPV